MKADASVRAITLDAAGTLFRVARPVAECYAQFAQDFAIPVTAEQINQQFRILFPRMTPLAFGQCNKTELHRQERSWWQTLVRNCLGPQGRHGNFSKFFDHLYNYYSSAEAWQLYPEVQAELERLRALDWPLSVVSNFDSRLLGILEALGIFEYFSYIHYSSRSGYAKPHAGIFTLACETLNTPPDATLHIGDHYQHDFLGARQAGLKAMWLDRSASSDEGPTLHTLQGLSVRLEH